MYETVVLFVLSCYFGSSACGTAVGSYKVQDLYKPMSAMAPSKVQLHSLHLYFVFIFFQKKTPEKCANLIEVFVLRHMHAG